jgi:hypothetical protein
MEMQGKVVMGYSYMGLALKNNILVYGMEDYKKCTLPQTK